MPPKYISQTAAGEILSVTDRTIRIYIATGKLRGFRVRGSRAIRVDQAEVLALLEPIPTTATA